MTGIRRWLLSFAVGGAVTSLPWLVSKLDSEALWPINLVMLPGGLIAVLLSGGNVHTYSLAVLLAANVILYAGGTYLVLRWRQK